MPRSERATLLLLGYRGSRAWETRYAVHGTEGVVVKEIETSVMRMERPHQEAKDAFVASLGALDARELRFLDRRIAREAKEWPYHYKQAGWARERIAERLAGLGPQPRRVNRTVLRIKDGWGTGDYVPVSHATDVVKLDVTALRSTSRIDHVDEVRKARALPPSLQAVLIERLQSWQAALKGTGSRRGLAAELGA